MKVCEIKAKAIRALVVQADEWAQDRPAQALGLIQMVEAAVELKQARRELGRVRRQNRANATVRYRNERSHGRSGLEARLKASPAQALAEAEATGLGRRHLCEIWESLGRVLLEKTGINEHEHRMACILLGAPDLQLRSSKARLDFERALAEDRDRKFEVIDERVERYMGVFLGRMGDLMMVNFCKEGDREAAMFATFLGRYKDWVQYLHHELQEEEQFYYDWKNRPPTGRPYWASTRKFIAQQLLKYRAMGRQNGDVVEESEPVLVWTAQEVRLAENARLAVNQSQANYQKAVGAAKVAGVFDGGKMGRKMC